MINTYIFHHDDLDGIASSYILKNYYFNVKCVTCSYEGDLINPLDMVKKGDTVIIADYSFQPEIMKKLYLLLGDNLVWLDHHISAINNSKTYKYNQIRGIRDTKYCGTELSWIWCKPNSNLPDLVKLIGEFDTFRNYGSDKFHKALCLFYGIKSYDETELEKAIKYFYINDLDYAQRYFYNFIDSGEIIYNYKKNEYKEYGKDNSYVKNIWGLKVLCMNTCFGGLSLQLPKIYNPKKHDMILTYYYNGKCWCYGFYTDSKNHPEIDCSQIAIKYGGGGHKGAAGATLNYLLEELI